MISGDTAGAAREVKEAGDPTQAAISPPLAAEIYGLEVLLEDVEDEDHNTTRFVVLSRDFAQAPPGSGPVVTSFVFNVRNLPAALYKALGGFATNGVNMTKLESYMVGGEFTATQFLAEVDGHPDDLPVKRALEELEFFTTEVKVLGVYPADPFRTVTGGRPTRTRVERRARRWRHHPEHRALRVGDHRHPTDARDVERRGDRRSRRAPRPGPRWRRRRRR